MIQWSKITDAQKEGWYLLWFPNETLPPQLVDGFFMGLMAEGYYDKEDDIWDTRFGTIGTPTHWAEREIPYTQCD